MSSNKKDKHFFTITIIFLYAYSFTTVFGTPAIRARIYIQNKGMKKGMNPFV